MNILELKGSLHDLIAKVNSANLLAELHMLIRELIQQKKEEKDWWDELSSRSLMRRLRRVSKKEIGFHMKWLPQPSNNG